MNESDVDIAINKIPQRKSHPLSADWRLRCEGKITQQELSKRIALNVMATIENYKWESLPPIPADVREFMKMSRAKQDDLSKNQLEDLQFKRDMWWAENERRWAKNKSNLEFLNEQRRILLDNGFIGEAAHFDIYILDMRERNIKTFREHTCDKCHNEFREEL